VHSASTSRVRLADIAAQAGVSTATVSRVLNGKDVVSATTRQAVHAALDVLGYERPPVKDATKGLIGLVIPELSNPVFPALAQTIESLLAQAGYTPLLCTQSPGGTAEDEYISMLERHGVDGIVFISGLHADLRASKQRYHRLRENRMPIVLFGGYAPSVDAPQVSSDEAAAMHLAVRHLVALGHRSIGFAVGPDRFVPSHRKRAGFTSALVQVGLAADIASAEQHVAANLYTVEGGQAAATTLLGSGHTAIVCASDLMALGAIRAVRQHGLRVPEDVSVVGYDDSPLMAFTDPPLTTVRQSIGALCKIVVQMLLAEIRGDNTPRTELLVEPDLVVRGSTSSAPKT
jgi:DNA-binding LacI/PurR family transcriptional regulator